MEGTRGDGAAAANQDRPIGDLAKQLSEQVSRLVREELRLAELEMARKGKRLGLAAGMFGGGGAVALYGVAAIVAAAILGLARVVPAWGSALIVGGVLFAISGVLAVLGRKQVKRATPPVPQQTVDSVKADVEEIKERAHR
jgi:Putative Actinobacterial Holin-X, holin superfamily III